MDDSRARAQRPQQDITLRAGRQFMRSCLPGKGTIQYWILLYIPCVVKSWFPEKRCY